MSRIISQITALSAALKHRWAATPFASVALLCVVAVSGCGGSRGAATNQGSALATTRNARHATVRLNVQWPAAPTRDIPVGTNRIVFYVNGANPADGTQSGAYAYVIDRPGVSASTASVSIDIPTGKKLLFSVVTRNVPTMNPAYTGGTVATPVSSNSPALTEGVATGSGNDGIAHTTVNVGDVVTADIRIAPAITPPSGTTSATVSVSQVLTGAFPSVISLQIIRDQDGNPIKNLNVGNFSIEENGTAAVITDVRTVQQAAQTLSISLVLDRSGSMADLGKNDGLVSAATQFVSLLQPGDLAEVINFSDSVNLSQSFTSDQALLTNAITGTSPGGGTALYDAIISGINDASGIKGRSAVIAVTDGIENSSQHSQSDVIDAASSQNVPVFTIGLGSDADTTTLQEIAANSGGTYTFAPGGADLQRIYTAITSQLDGQIQISFISPNPVASGTLRHLKIRLQYGLLSSEASTDYRL